MEEDEGVPCNDELLRWLDTNTFNSFTSPWTFWKMLIRVLSCSFIPSCSGQGVKNCVNIHVAHITKKVNISINSSLPRGSTTLAEPGTPDVM